MKVRNKRDFRNDIISVFQPPSPTTKNTKLNSRTTEQVLKPRRFYYRTLRLLHATFHRVLFFDHTNPLLLFELIFTRLNTFQQLLVTIYAMIQIGPN